MKAGEVGEPTSWRLAVLPTLSLFTSLSTLVCCALPALLVTLGMGAALAGLVTAVPQLVWLSEHKALTFGTAGVLLAGAGYMLWRARNAPCPADPAQARACARMRRFSVWTYFVSLALYLTAVFFAFLAADLLV